MLKQITGLHHVTSLSGDAFSNNRFFTHVLGLRRVKKTVNFDVPNVYHLYYGDRQGSPGTVMTYFPYPNLKGGRPGKGEVGTVAFSVPEGSLAFWRDRLTIKSVENLAENSSFGENRLDFDGIDGDRFALVETTDDLRQPWECNGIDKDCAIRGFHSASMRVKTDGPMRELLSFMNYQRVDTDGKTERFLVDDGNGANVIDLEFAGDHDDAVQGAGSVHHIAFSVDTRKEQEEVQSALRDTGYKVTPVIDRDYFFAIYFRTPDGILFEVATAEPGFDRDEDSAHLGQALKLPRQHDHLRDHLERELPAL